MTTRQKRREKESGDYATQEQGRNVQRRNECNRKCVRQCLALGKARLARRCTRCCLATRVGDPKVFGMELEHEELGKVR